MKDIWSTNVQYYIDLILMEGPCSYTMDSGKNNRCFIVHGYMLDNIQACLYMGRYFIIHNIYWKIFLYFWNAMPLQKFQMKIL